MKKASNTIAQQPKRTYRPKKQQSLKPDQTLPEDGAASGLQHAFPSTIGLATIKEFDFSQSSKDGVNVGQVVAAETSETTSVETPTLPTTMPLKASAGKSLGACGSGQLELPKAQHEDEMTSQNDADDDSDSCDFNEIDIEIQDKLQQRSVSSEEEQIVRASERFDHLSSEKVQNILDESSTILNVTATANVTTSSPQQQRVETTSTADSALAGGECSTYDWASPFSFEQAEAIWCVTIPSEAVLYVNSLQDFLTDFGKVLSVKDINDYIQVQYEEKIPAQNLQRALQDMSIQAQVAPLICSARVPNSIKKKLFQDPDAQQTLNLLCLKPKELEVRKTDSEFLKDYNTTAMQQPVPSSQAIITTDGSENLSTEAPSLEMAYKMMTTSQISSDVGIFYPPKSASNPGYMPQQTGSQVTTNKTRYTMFEKKHPQDLPMQSMVFSDQSTVCPSDGQNPSYEGFQDSSLLMYGGAGTSSVATASKPNPFVPSAAVFHPTQSSTNGQQQANFGSSLTNQNQFENDQFGQFETEQYPASNQQQAQQPYPQCLQNGPNRQNVPQQVKNPFADAVEGQGQDVPLPAMTPGCSTFVPTNASIKPSCGPSNSAAPTTYANKQGGGGQNPNPEFAVDLDRILSGEDARTTIMIRHIPNKYTEDMLLDRINRHHEGRYDFFYLPLDLNNGCNIGYAFINFVDPLFIVPFYQDLNNQSWETFNSEKICQIAYGRLQGKRDLVNNVNKQQPDTRKIKPLILEVNQCPAAIESLRMELIAARHLELQQRYGVNTTSPTAPNTDFRHYSSRRGQQQRSSMGPNGHHYTQRMYH